MAGGSADIPTQGLNVPEIAWAQEVRDYLLGRLSVHSVTGPLQHSQVTSLTNPPIRRWWVFEGKRYSMLNGSLALNWDSVFRNAARLKETFNPRLQLSDRPDGVVDWGHTLARGPHRLRHEYVVRSSGVGLDEDEHSALRGWMSWIAFEWNEYICGTGIEAAIPWPVEQTAPNEETLRRWAHTARRSRWPLLYSVVAESLRPILEPEELDRIPLPAERATLFELLCLVRVAGCIAPRPRELRWLTADICSNEIKLDGVRVHYQQPITSDAVLATPDYSGALASAVEAFHIRVPKLVDLAFDFDMNLAGFDGLIIEAKSGAQTYDAAVAQLRTYRSARPRRPGSRYLVWGIVENPGIPDATVEEFQHVLAAVDPGEDVWIFSSAEAIPIVLNNVLGVQNTS